MTLEERQVGSVTVLDLAGQLTLDHAALLKDKVNSLVSQDRTNIVLNLARLTYMDSAGLGQMVGCHNATRGKGGVKLANLGKRLNDLLVMTRLITVFDVYDSEDEAVASFESA